MKREITHLVLYKSNNHVLYKVYYKSGATRSYRENDNLPDTVVQFLVNSTVAETTVKETGTRTRFS